MENELNIVLVAPLIPQNTGSTARLTAATNSKLHLVKPLGFELSDRYLKRAGLDYWAEVNLTVHESWSDFLTKEQPEDLWLFTKFATKPHWEIKYSKRVFLVFGNESNGLPAEIHALYPEKRICLPMDNKNVRSLNLSNTASVALYEVKRQWVVNSDII